MDYLVSKMKNLYAFTKIGILVLLVCLTNGLNAQTTVTTSHSFNNYAFNSIIFNVQNNNVFPITVNTVSCHLLNAGNHNWTVLYNPTAVLSSSDTWTQGDVGDGLNGWVSAGTGTIAGTAGVNMLTDALYVVVPPGRTYGFCVNADDGSGQGLSYEGLFDETVYTATAGNVNIITGGNVGWSGDNLPFMPFRYPRGFIGSIAFVRSVPTLTSFTPTVAPAGSTITISGSSFTGASSVSFGGVAASSFTVLNDSTISAVVASGASGTVSVVGPTGTASLAGFVLCIPVTPTIAINATATTICTGTSITFSASITNGGTSPSYQWNKNGVPITGATSATYSVSSLVNNDAITCTITSNAVCAIPPTKTSNSIKVTVNPKVTPTISINASASNICSGSSVTFSSVITNGGGSPSYQWKINGINISGATAPTFTRSTLANNDLISVVLTSNVTCATTTSATSNSVKMTVNANLTPSISIVANKTSICAGTSVSFTANTANAGTAAPLWYVNGSSVGATGNTYSSNSLANNDKVTAVLNSNATCAVPTQVTSNAITITVTGVANTWTGAISTDWSVGGNWCSNTVPLAGSNINIPVVATGRYPVLAANTAISNLSLPTGTSLSLNGKTLTINGLVSGTGVLKGSSTSSLVVNSSSTSIVYFNKVANDSLLNALTISGTGGAKLGTGVGITGLLSLNAGNLNLNGNFLTLKSTSISATAAVGPITNGATITGSVTVERYIPKGFKAYRQLGAGGVYNAGSFFNNWQEKGSRPMGYGTYIIGNKSTSPGFNATTGLDNTTNGNRGLFIYTNNAWDSIANTKTTNIDPCIGYHVAMFGDRNVNLYQNKFDTSSSMTNATTIRTTGQLVTGTITFGTTNTTGGGFGTSSAKLSTVNNAGSFIANPYACAIDWHAVTKTGLTNNYYYFDPSFLVSNSYQVFVSYNASTGTNSNPTLSKINRYIQPAQAFWVENTASNSTRQLVIAESNKVTNQSFTAVYKTSKPINRLAISLWKNLEGIGSKNIDGAVAVFDQEYAKAYGAEDAKKMQNSKENLAIVEGNQDISIDGLPMPNAGDILPLKLWNLVPNTSYQLHIDATEFSSKGQEAFLVDALLGKQVKIETEGLEYRFGHYEGSTERFSIQFANAKFNPIIANTQNDGKASIRVFPNPVVDNKIQLFCEALPKGNYQVVVYNALGKVEIRQSIKHLGGAGKYTIELNASISSGFYTIVLNNESSKVCSASLFIR